MLYRFVRACLAFLGLLFLLVTFSPIDNWWLHLLAGPWNDPKGDVLIVLGAESFNDAMGISSYIRGLYALRAWREGGFRQIVLSGGSRNGGDTIAEQMRDFLVCHGVPAAAIVLENRSHDTHENAVFTKELLASNPARKVLLTSDYHMFRAIRAFHKAGLDVQPRPIPDDGKRIAVWYGRWPVFLALCLETSKSAYYKTRGWV